MRGARQANKLTFGRTVGLFVEEASCRGTRFGCHRHLSWGARGEEGRSTKHGARDHVCVDVRKAERGYLPVCLVCESAHREALCCAWSVGISSRCTGSSNRAGAVGLGVGEGGKGWWMNEVTGGPKVSRKSWRCFKVHLALPFALPGLNV